MNNDDEVAELQPEEIADSRRYSYSLANERLDSEVIHPHPLRRSLARGFKEEGWIIDAEPQCE